MHSKSYEKEKPPIDKINEYIVSKRMEICGHHHEIYLSDPGRTPEDRLKTILRYAVKLISIH